MNYRSIWQKLGSLQYWVSPYRKKKKMVSNSSWSSLCFPLKFQHIITLFFFFFLPISCHVACDFSCCHKSHECYLLLQFLVDFDCISALSDGPSFTHTFCCMFLLGLAMWLVLPSGSDQTGCKPRSEMSLQGGPCCLATIDYTPAGLLSPGERWATWSRALASPAWVTPVPPVTHKYRSKINWGQQTPNQPTGSQL